MEQGHRKLQKFYFSAIKKKKKKKVEEQIPNQHQSLSDIFIYPSLLLRGVLFVFTISIQRLNW